MTIQFKNFLGKPRSVTTPTGIFRFPALQEARKNPFKEDQMEYQCNIALTPDEAAPLLQELDVLFQENLANVAQDNKNLKSIKASNKPYGEEKDKEGVPTGFIVFRTKALAGGISKKTNKPWEFRVKLFNADLSPFTEAVPIGGGTKGKLQFDVTGYYVKGEAGIKLNLRGAQILKFVPAGKSKGEDFGFKSEDMPSDDVQAYDSGVSN